MKKLFTILVAFCAILCTSCSKSTPDDTEITGKWAVNEINIYVGGELYDTDIGGGIR